MSKSIYVSIFLIVVIFLGGWYFDHQLGNKDKIISDLRSDLVKSDTATALCESNRTTLKDTIKRRNEEIEKNKIDKLEADERWNNRKKGKDFVEEWKIGNRFYDTNATKGDNCEINNDIFDAIRKRGF